MKRFIFYFITTLFVCFVASCTVTNNMYMNNPTPMGKGETEGYAGIAMGLKPQIDSVSVNGNINYSNNIKQAIILTAGGQYGISDNLDIRAAIHLPQLIGGLGLRLGGQYGFIKKTSPFNLAVGADFGYVLSREYIKLFGEKIHFKDAVNIKGGVNADIFLPLSIKPDKNIQLILTPRYSINSVFIRKNTNQEKSTGRNISFPVLTLGIKIYKFYFETSGAYYNNKIYPFAGIAVAI